MLLGRMIPSFGPASGQDFYKFLFTIVTEWQFFHNAQALDLSLASPSVVRGADLALLETLDQWNEWIFRNVGKEWLWVVQRKEIAEDTLSKTGIFFQAGTSVLVSFVCLSAPAIIKETETKVFGPKGESISRDRDVFLQCVLAPPYDDSMRELPVTFVPSISLFND